MVEWNKYVLISRQFTSCNKCIDFSESNKQVSTHVSTVDGYQACDSLVIKKNQVIPHHNIVLLSSQIPCLRSGTLFLLLFLDIFPRLFSPSSLIRGENLPTEGLSFLPTLRLLSSHLSHQFCQVRPKVCRSLLTRSRKR